MSILIDTSIWVDLLGKARRYRITADQLPEVATCPPIIQEVLQGVKDEKVRERLKDRFLALTCVGDPTGLDLYLEAAELYATGRRKGLTIRSSIDCLIAAIALRGNLTVWHSDRDFEAISKFTSLKTHTGATIEVSA